MADYHILNADQYGNTFKVVMHFPVADTLNQAGTSYRTAIVEWQGGAPIQSALLDAGAEQTQLDAGELYEISLFFYSNPEQTLIQKRDQLDAIWATKQTQVQQQLQKALEYWGYSRIIS